MKILAIDTSADETSVAITEGFRVLSSTISSQISSHVAWGGIVPTIARLAHEERIDAVIQKTLQIAKREGHLQNDHVIDAVAVTLGPGLSIALEVGIQKAKELVTSWNKPLIAVNHMEGHMYAPYVGNSAGNPIREVIYPFISILISGGHTQLILVSGNGKYEVLGETVDDAAGEALDKAGKMLGLGYPGGPIIERLAKSVDNKDRFKFPRPMMYEKNLMFSFSGLKTHLFYFLKGQKGQEVDLARDLAFIASSFQEAVFDCIVYKLEKAMVQTGVSRLAVGGGVSANKRLRRLIRNLAKRHQGQALFPAYPYLCGDNAAMIGVAAYMQAQRNEYVEDIERLSRVPRLRL